MEALAGAGAEVIVAGETASEASHVDLRSALSALSRRHGVNTVLCEGGPTLAGALLDEGLAGEVAAFVAPKLAGGAAAPGPVGGTGASRMEQCLRPGGLRVRRLGEDWLFTGLIESPFFPS